MSTLIVVRAGTSAVDGSQIGSYYREASRRAATTSGFRGGRLYRNAIDASDHMIVWHYANIAAAEEGLIAVATGPALPQYQSSGSPAHVVRAKVLHVNSPTADGLPNGEYMSISERVADPGFGHKLADELDRIFSELQMLPGFTGSVVAANETLDEEVLGIATWASPEAFQKSLPTGILYEVRFYKRVA